MITNRDINYPAILIGTDNSLEVILSFQRLSITNKLGLKNGVLMNNLIIDYRGVFFKPIKVIKLKNVNPFWKFEFFNPMYEVQIELEVQPPISFDELKKKVAKSLKSELQFWDFPDKESVDKDLKNLDDIQKVIDLLVSKK